MRVSHFGEEAAGCNDVLFDYNEPDVEPVIVFPWMRETV